MLLIIEREERSSHRVLSRYTVSPFAGITNEQTRMSQRYCGIGFRRGLYSGGWTGCIANPLHSLFLQLSQK